MKLHLVLAALVTSVAFSSCTTQPYTGERTSTEVARIVGDVQRTLDEMRAQQEKLNASFNAVILERNRKDQFISDSVISAQFYLRSVSDPTSVDELTLNELKTTDPLLLPQSAASKEDMIRKLELALSNSNTDRQKLKEKLTDLDKKAVGLAASYEEASKRAEEQASAAKVASAKLDSHMSELSQAKIDASLKAKEAADAAAQVSAERASKTRMIVATIFMVLGGIVIVVGIVMAYFGLKNVIGASFISGATLLVVGWLITYVEELLQLMWFKITVGSVVAAVVVYAVVSIILAIRHKIKQVELTEKVAVSSIGAIQDMKNDDKVSGSSNYVALKPYLEEWNLCADGKPDKSLTQFIDSKLVDMNLRTPSTKDGSSK